VHHVQMVQEKLVLGNTEGAHLTPIGDEDVIRQTTPAQLRSFYDGHYRPENTTLVVVGDVDARSVEAAIRKKFGDWRGKGPPVPRHVAAQASTDSAKIAIVSEPGAPTAVLYSWIKPGDESADSRERYRRNLIELVGLSIFNFRLSKLAADRD